MTDSKRSKITPEHQQESARLKALWDDGRPHRTQAVFGEAYGLGNQANVGHYLNGRSPLNPKAAVAFAAELGCSVSDFSPRVAEELARLVEPTGPASAPAHYSEAAALAPDEPSLGQTLARLGQELGKASPQTRAAVADLLSRYAQNPAQGQSLAQAIEMLVHSDTHKEADA